MSTPRAMTVANDRTLVSLIEGAQRRLVVIAPGVSTAVARVLAKQWKALGADSVSVALDVDEEVCRLGYGDIEAVRLLEACAATLHTTLNTQPGLRIGVIVADDRTLVYSPTPLHVEAAPTTRESPTPRPNAVMVGSPPAQLASDLGIGPEGAKSQAVGLDPVARERVREVEARLATVPPQPVNISRMMRVYTTHVEFAELRLTGCALQRRTIKLPADLMGFMDPRDRQLLESKFHLVGEADAGIWGTEVRTLKDFIAERFLVHVPTYGSLLRRRDKEKFLVAVRALQRMLYRSRDRTRRELQAVLDRRVTALHRALLPGVTKSPPERWKPLRKHKPIAEILLEELTKLVGTAQDLLDQAEVTVRFKGVTFDTLADKKFVEAVREGLPDLDRLHEEGTAVATGRRSP